MSEDNKTPQTEEEGSSAAVDTSSGFTIPDDSPGWSLAERVCWHILEKKGEDIVVLDLRGRSDVCDFFVLASANSDVQVRAVAKNVQDLLVGAGHKAKGAEGLNEGRWALLDYFDVIVHVFKTDVRDYFQIERLWGDAGRLDIGDSWFASDEVAARHPDLKFITAADSGGTD